MLWLWFAKNTINVGKIIFRTFFICAAAAGGAALLPAGSHHRRNLTLPLTPPQLVYLVHA